MCWENSMAGFAALTSNIHDLNRALSERGMEALKAEVVSAAVEVEALAASMSIASMPGTDNLFHGFGIPSTASPVWPEKIKLTQLSLTEKLLLLALNSILLHLSINN